MRVWLMIVMIAVYIMVVRKVFMQGNARVYISAVVCKVTIDASMLGII